MITVLTQASVRVLSQPCLRVVGIILEKKLWRAVHVQKYLFEVSYHADGQSKQSSTTEQHVLGKKGHLRV